MLTGPWLVAVFIFAIALLLVMIIRWRVDPFLALLLTAIATGILVGMPFREIGVTITRGFGNTLGGIGIVIGLGILLGSVLVDAGATDQIADRMLRVTGARRAPLALNATGYLISIPVFVDAAFVILIPLVERMSRKTGQPWITYVTALSVGMIVTHTIVVPTPGPLAVASNMNLDVGIFLLYALIVSLPAALVGGWLYGLWLGRKNPQPAGGPLSEEPTQEGGGTRPSGRLSLALLLCPIVLILLGSLFGLLLPDDLWLTHLLAFFGDKNIALLVAVLIALVALRRYRRRSPAKIVEESASAAGLILLITGAGGAFGHVISTGGIGSYLVDSLAAANVSLLFLGFVLAAILRGAQGSATVALITTSAILGPTAATAGASPILVGLAVCAGGTCLSLPNDSAFWVVSRFAKLSVRETLRSWSVGGTLAGVTVLLMVLLLGAFGGLLPGL
ncbi:MAG TPA: GntP family permease [Rhodothermales bacterium]